MRHNMNCFSTSLVTISTQKTDVMQQQARQRQDVELSIAGEGKKNSGSC